MPIRFFETSEFVLPAHSVIRRNAPTPPELQRENYMGLFDSQTVFCDVFMSGDDLVMVGPPLFNLEEHLAGASFAIDGSRSNSFETKVLNRAQRSWFEGVTAVDELAVSFSEVSATLRVRSDQNHLLAGRKVLLGMQRNNPLHWLSEWATLFNVANGVDAVVLYDMVSTQYTKEEIAAALESVPGIEVVIIVSWPYKYGAQPIDPDNHPWDSDFGQYVAWEHALRRFLQRAHAVTVADVDEIFIAGDGRSIFDHAAESPNGVVKFSQRDILPVVDSAPTDSRDVAYANYRYYDPAAELSTVKYAAILDRLHTRHQLLVHTVAHDYTPPSDVIVGRQFVPMKLAWLKGSFERLHVDTVEQSPGLAVDDQLVELYDRALRESGPVARVESVDG